jgi:hypothetical protein
MTVSSSDQMPTAEPAVSRPATDKANVGNGIEPKDWLLFAPVLGSAVAVIYDVGLFYGLDISFFAFFSIGEHLLFALEALPVTFVIAVVVIWFVGESASSRLRKASYPESSAKVATSKLLVTLLVLALCLLASAW